MSQTTKNNAHANTKKTGETQSKYNTTLEAVRVRDDAKCVCVDRSQEGGGRCARKKYMCHPPSKYRVLFQLRRCVRPVSTPTSATTSAVTAGQTTFLLEKTEPTVDVLGAAARIVHAASRHRHADHQDADGHHDHRCDHRHQEVEVKPFGNQMGEVHLAVAVAAVRAVAGRCQSTYPYSHSQGAHSFRADHNVHTFAHARSLCVG